MLRVLKLAGNYVREEMLAAFIRLVTQTTELQGYTVQKLYAALKEDISQESLTLAGVWIIGEYGDILVGGGNYEEEELAKEVRDHFKVSRFRCIRTIFPRLIMLLSSCSRCPSRMLSICLRPF